MQLAYLAPSCAGKGKSPAHQQQRGKHKGKRKSKHRGKHDAGAVDMQAVYERQRRRAEKEAERQRVLNLPPPQAHRMANLMHLSLAGCRLSRLPKYFGGMLGRVGAA